MWTERDDNHGWDTVFNIFGDARVEWMTCRLHIHASHDLGV